MEAKIEQITLHKVGNKFNNGQIFFSKSLIPFDEKLQTSLSQFFFSTINQNAYYNLYHESDLFLNEIYTYASRIFEDCSKLYEESLNIAKHLYLKSEHPKIKDGDLYVTYLTDCVVEGQSVNAIGIFKSENRETIINASKETDSYSINTIRGGNIKKLDKGCIIYNVDKEHGFLVSIIDNSSKTGYEAQYWKDDFLYVKSRKDDYYNTGVALNFCKSFIESYMEESLNIPNEEKIDLLNKTAEYFKSNKSFEIADFAEKIITGDGVKENFLKYKSEYENDTEITIPTQFSISEGAVKKQIRSFKKAIKLDNNFKILIEGDNENLEKGYDKERGMFYYTLYFKQEE